ncbi:unnamed protein product [Scytosiphon promiscuus]
MDALRTRAAGSRRWSGSGGGGGVGSGRGGRSAPRIVPQATAGAAPGPAHGAVWADGNPSGGRDSKRKVALGTTGEGAAAAGVEKEGASSALCDCVVCSP